MHIFRATRIGGYIFLQHCSSGWGGHKIFDHQIEGVTKMIAEVLQKFMTPYSKENGGPLNIRKHPGNIFAAYRPEEICMIPPIQELIFL